MKLSVKVQNFTFQTTMILNQNQKNKFKKGQKYDYHWDLKIDLNQFVSHSEFQKAIEDTKVISDQSLERNIKKLSDRGFLLQKLSFI